MSILQLLAHAFSQAKNYIGLPAELTVDQSNWNLRLHDGSTKGGRVILNRDNADQRYQARSVELDGLLGFEPQDNGILVRLGPANYRLRSLQVNVENLSVEDGDGYDGNPTISLAPTITSEHVWDADQTFNGGVAWTAGATGDLTGNVTGNLTGDVTGDVTGDLTGNATGDHTGSFTGDLNTVGKEVVMDDEQIKLSYLDQDSLDYIASRGIPPGTIVMWTGELNEIPEGWALCDGSNDTPDLSERFVIGAKLTGTFIRGATGGSKTHTPSFTIASGGAHTHTGNVGETTLSIDQIPSHRHGSGVTVQNSGSGPFNRGTKAASPGGPRGIDPDAAGSYEIWGEEIGGGEPHTHSLTTEAGGAHTHTAEAETVNHMPPYFALAYIMKLAYS